MADSTGGFSVTIDGLDELANTFANAPQILSPILSNALNAGMAILAKHTTRGNVPWASGNLVHSFRQDVRPMMATWYPTANYASSVEYGSPPNRIEYASDEFASLTKWSAQKGLNPYAVRNSIAKKGTMAHPFMQRIVDDSSIEINSLFEKALAQMTQALAQ